MNSIPSPSTVVPAANYDGTRFNALRHGVLSGYAVLPWEDRSEYDSLLSALVAEHAPQGPTEEHLVEELAGIIWRKRRLRMAEAAIYREKLRKGCHQHHRPGSGIRERCATSCDRQAQGQGRHSSSTHRDTGGDGTRPARCETGIIRGPARR